MNNKVSDVDMKSGNKFSRILLAAAGIGTLDFLFRNIYSFLYLEIVSRRDNIIFNGILKYTFFTSVPTVTFIAEILTVLFFISGIVLLFRDRSLARNSFLISSLSYIANTVYEYRNLTIFQIIGSFIVLIVLLSLVYIITGKIKILNPKKKTPQIFN